MSSFWASLSTTQPSQSQQDADELAQAQATAAAAAAAASQSSLFSQPSVGSQLFRSASDHHAEHNEVCLTCGSSDFLTDDATGVTVCAQCHTQSQTLSQVEVVGEEDVEALAARTGKGRMVSRRIGGRRKLASVEEIDNSVKLPGVEECLGGFQYLLREAAECAADLVGLVEPDGDDDDDDDDDDDGNDGRQVLIDTVGNIWFGYLTSWREGAKKNSRLHPEVRFSLRDAFLGENRRGMVLRHLSARCCEEIRAEEERLDRISKKSGKGRGQKRRRGDQQSPSPNANTATSSGQDRQIFGSVAALLDSLPSDQIDDQIAALRLVPSLSLIGSIIHLALTVMRAGVSSHHIVGWAASGAFPYLTDAFRQLSPEFKHTLKPMKSFFTQTLPPPGLLDYQADILAIACGMKLGRSSNSPGSADNIPLLVTRIVSDLGFDKQVLDYTLSLLGVRELPPPEQEWAPKPLVKNIRRLISPLHVMAVVVVAVRMCEGWESRTYHMEWSCGPNSAQTKPRKGNVFIPSSEAQVSQLSNGQLDQYLAFLESNVFDKHSRRNTLIRPFTTSLQEMGKQHSKSLKKDEDGRPSDIRTVRQNVILAGAKISDDHNCKKKNEKADEDYGTYTVFKSCLTSQTRGDDQSEPGFLDPPYALLIEYVAYKADAEPSDLHRLVMMLDKEVFAKVSKRDKKLGALMTESGLPIKTPGPVQGNKKSVQKKAAAKSKETERLNLPRCTNPSASTYQHHGLYQQNLSEQPPLVPKPKRKNKRCTIEGCEMEGIKKYNHMCLRHYNQSIGQKPKQISWKTLL